MNVLSPRLTGRLFALTAFLTLAAAPAVTAQAPRADQPNRLVTGKDITLPPLGTQQNVGSLPMNIILSPDGKHAVSTDMGFRESLWSLDTTTGQGISHLEFMNTTSPFTNGLYYGLAAAPHLDGTSTIYAAQGGNASIAVVKLATDGTLTQTGTIAATQPTDFPAGLALDDRGYLYVANNDPSTFLVPGSVAVYNTRAASPAEVGRVTFVHSYAGTPNFPLAVAALKSGSKVYVSSQRDDAVYVLNTTDPHHPFHSATLPTGSHPISLLLDKSQKHLYVANANSDTVSIVNTADDTIRATILLRPSEARGLPGVTPTGLALSPDEKTLYVTLGDMNAVAVVSTASNELQGYIPTGWYPSSLVVSPVKKQLLVVNAKGTRTRYPNPQYSINPNNPGNSLYYDLNLIEGNVSTIGIPDASGLSADTAQVIANNRLTAGIGNPPNPLDGIGLQAGKITHIVYIIKENRTYDQVMGDATKGNGDPSLAIFGSKVTPNFHTLAGRFVLLDNFYDCGEVSGDGWNWSTQSFANEQVIKNLPYNYSGRGRNYDFEGQNNGYIVGGFPPHDPNGQQNSDLLPHGAPAIPDVSRSPSGYIWDSIENAGLTYRNYGFFYSFGVTVNGSKIIPDNYPGAPGLQPPGHNLNGISDFDFRRFDLNYPDSDAPAIYGAPYPTPVYGRYNAQSRYEEWNREFQLMLAQNPLGHTVPVVMTIRLMSDHTSGYTPGLPSPRAHVADNDYGVAQVVDAISHSPIWPHTAIFVIEDDAQDGPDHVDCHRSTCYVISPYIKHNSVDHTFYNTDSVLKTMELLLGLHPLSQYDAVADPILDWDTAPNNSEPYVAILPDQAIVTERNPSVAALKGHPALSHLAALSAKMDLTHPDSAPADLLNEVIWKSIKGLNSVMPAPRHNGIAGLHRPAQGKSASVKATAPRDDD